MSDTSTMLVRAAAVIRAEGHNGWGNICEQAAEELAAANARLLNYTRLSESGESLGGELEERERRLEVERQLSVAREHVRHLLVLARRAGIVNTETKVADKWLQEQDNGDKT